MRKDSYIKRRFILVIYILILFTGITFINKQEKKMNLPIIDLEETQEKKEEKVDFTIASIEKIDLDDTKKVYMYRVEVKEKLDNTNCSKISAMVLDNIKDKEDFGGLSLDIINDEEVIFSFKY